ncbi:hypothetical protein ABC383_16890 [Noviherbaspirillum sp. 1P10PC]|uniref:hypothetical protein n=1 Tax=Noviherbaspirillum sp. 1P10PC TaxID=3132292 RepID=UPI0039A2F8C3
MERGAAKLAKQSLAQTDAAPFPAPRTDVTARSTGLKSNYNGNVKSHYNDNGNRNRNRNCNCNRNRNRNCSAPASPA